MMQPVETTYRGYRFRSRTEAKWAVFLDALNLKWEYEKEGYDLEELGWYLPDFWLPEFDLWAEVKGQAFTENEIRKCCGLNLKTGRPVLMCIGTPGDNPTPYVSAGGVESFNWGMTLFKGRVWLNYGEPEECTESPDHSLFCRAAVAARSARFEHGESGSEWLVTECRRYARDWYGWPKSAA